MWLSPDISPGHAGNLGEFSIDFSLSPTLKPVFLPERLNLTKENVQAIIFGLGAGSLTGNISRRRLLTTSVLAAGGYLGAEFAFDNLGVLIDNKVKKLGQALRYGIVKVADIPQGLQEEANNFLSRLHPSFLVSFLGDLSVNKGLIPSGCAVRTCGEENGFLTVKVKDRSGSSRIFIADGTNGGTLYELEPPSGFDWANSQQDKPHANIAVGYEEGEKLSATVVQTDTVPETHITKIYLPIVMKNKEFPTVPEGPFPLLSVEGPYITYMKEREKVYAQFKGASICTFFNGTGKLDDTTRYYIAKAKEWGINHVRLNFDTGFTDLAELVKTVDYLADQWMFCSLCPGSFNGVGFHNPVYQESLYNRLIVYMDNLARRLKDKTNIMYELTGEPGPVQVAPGDWRFATWEEWVPWAGKLAEAIRNVRSDVLLGLPGVNWGRDFTGFKGHPEGFPYKDFCCTVHPYRWFLYPGTPKEEEITPPASQWDWMIGTYPVFIPEMGVPVNMGGRTHWADSVVISEMLSLMEENPYMIQVSGFEMSPETWRSSLLIDSSGEPSSRGQPYYDNYINPNSRCPPSDFSK